MKTFEEAMKCLEKPPAECGDVTLSHVNFDEKNESTVESSGPGRDDAGMVSLVEIGKMVGTNEDVKATGHMIILMLLGVDGPGKSVQMSAANANLLSSLWVTAFTYGVRVGMEMEKAEEPAIA